jgi:hypothetical protein
MLATIDPLCGLAEPVLGVRDLPGNFAAFRDETC